MTAGDELFIGGDIGTEIAGEEEWRRADAHMNFLRPGFFEHADQVFHRRTAHDRVIDEDNAFSPDSRFQNIKLDTDAIFAFFLGRFDEGSADIAIFMENKMCIRDRIYSICGLLKPDTPLVLQRPFRSPHHSTTAQAMAGGGRNPKPGEISLASYGTLFLDELTEFQPKILDLLRQPMEEGSITVSRLNPVSYTHLDVYKRQQAWRKPGS